MPDAIDISVEIDPGSPFIVGANPQSPNELKITITNRGGSVQWSKANGYFTMRGLLGSGADALFMKEEDARRCKRILPDGWDAVWKFHPDASPQGIFELMLQTSRNPFLDAGEVLVLQLGSIISTTAPGTAELTLELGTGILKWQLNFTKEIEQPGIIDFSSNPPEGTLNLPGDTVTLKWATHELTGRKLQQVGISEFLVCAIDKDQGEMEIACGDTGKTFRLIGYAGNEKKLRDLHVQVLDKGWHDLKRTLYEGDPGYFTTLKENKSDQAARPAHGIGLEPLSLFNANDQLLYGLFRLRTGKADTDLLYKAVNPFGPWQFIEACVPYQESNVPRGCATSPGVYANECLWLIGGSRIDPERTSNSVWRLHTETWQWEQLENAPWESRMGHAVVVFQNRIWVMGGRDAAGNALKDVWAFDWNAKKKPWESKDRIDGDSRCLAGSAVSENRIWLYGGTPEPFAERVYNDLHSFDGIEWQREKTGSISDRDPEPFAVGLQEFNGMLRLFGKYRSVNSTDGSERIEPQAFTLTDPDANKWESFPVEALNGWGDDTSFSYQWINYGNRMLIGLALGYEQADPCIKVYVPG